MRPSAPCISELAAVRLRVAAGVSPAVEPWRLARRHPRAKSECALNLVADSGRQDAALYGRRDACRYRRIGDAPPSALLPTNALSLALLATSFGQPSSGA